MTHAPDTTQDLKAAAARDEFFASRVLVPCARRRGCDTQAEGPHFEVEIAAEFLGRQGVTYRQVCRQMS